MRKLILFVFALVLLLPIKTLAITFENDSNISSSGGTSSGCNKQSCWNTFGSGYGYQAIRVTIYHKNGTKVSNSVDFTNYTNGKDNLSGKTFYRVTEKRSKIDYIKDGDKGNFKFTMGNGANIHRLKFTDFIDPPAGTSLICTDLVCLLQDYLNTSTNLISQASSDFSYCTGKYKCEDQDILNYYIVVEPATLVKLDGNYYYGTYYELKWLYNTSPFSISGSSSNPYYWASTIVTRYLPKSLTLSGNNNFKTFYNNVGLDYSDYVKNDNTSDNNDAYGIGVLKAKGYIPKPPPPPEPQRQNITCSSFVDINECGTSTIKEPTGKECVSDNAVYSYLSSCNLYCSDTVTTDFSGLYDTFIGTNKLNAIKSGKYQSIKGNPKITITKTCYQSKTANECPNVTESFKAKLNQDYKTNNMILSVDGNSYTLIGSPTISNNGYSSATITYEYKLNDNVNKYINIETMKGVDLTEENKNKVIINGTPMIITSKASYGVYNYSLDVSGTVLNKYISSGSVVRNFKNAINDKYNIQNKLTITYKEENGSSKTSYNNNDLKYSCSYVKYDTSKGCIGTEGTCYDSITCEPVECPPPANNPNGEPCECKSEYGCLNDGKCTAINIKDTTEDDGDDDDDDNKTPCNPEKEVCMPNVIYRPISLTDPFPGIDGDGRIPGSNWNRVVKIEGTNKYYSVIDYYITNNRGYKDYEVYQAEPLYVIKLDSDTIKAIREYNDYKKNNYNDFDLECSNGEYCISKFLRGRADHFSIDLLEEISTCKNITPDKDSFNRCIKRKGA